MPKKITKGGKKGSGTAWAGPRLRPWTASEVRELKTLVRRKTTAANIARKLKRTEGATRQKAFSIGLSLKSRNR
jgi:hypothetical protein